MMLNYGFHFGTPGMSDTTLLPSQESNFQLYLSLVSGKFKPGKVWYDRSYRIKYLLRSLIYPLGTWRMLNALSHEPELRSMLPLQHTLPGKMQRPYLYNGIRGNARAKAMIHHYRFVRDLPWPELRNGFLTAEGVNVLAFEGKEGESFLVTLACTGRCEREGEVNLFISCNGVQLSMLTFSIMQKGGETVALIGGIQGAHRDTPHSLIRDATKACYGLFPKRLLMEAMGLMCTRMNVTKIHAVSDHGHVFRSLRYHFKKKRLFHASYNEFLEGFDVQPLTRDLYAVPLTFARKSLEALPSKKRSEYRKRYALLNDLHAQFDHFLQR